MNRCIKALMCITMTACVLTTITACSSSNKDKDSGLAAEQDVPIQENREEVIDKTNIANEVQSALDEEKRQEELKIQIEEAKKEQERVKTPEEIAHEMGAGSELCLKVFGDMHAEVKLESSNIPSNNAKNIRDYFFYTTEMRDKALKDIENRKAWAQAHNKDSAEEGAGDSIEEGSNDGNSLDINTYFIPVPVPDWEAEDRQLSKNYTYDFGEYPLEKLLDTESGLEHNFFGYKIYFNKSDKKYNYNIEANIEIELTSELNGTEDYKLVSCKYMKDNENNPYRTKSSSQVISGFIKNNYSGSTIGSYDISNNSKVKAMSSSSNILKSIKDNYGINISVTLYGNVTSLENKDVDLDKSAESGLRKYVTEMQEYIWKIYDMEDAYRELSSSSVINLDSVD